MSKCMHCCSCEEMWDFDIYVEGVQPSGGHNWTASKLTKPTSDYSVLLDVKENLLSFIFHWSPGRSTNLLWRPKRSTRNSCSALGAWREWKYSFVVCCVAFGEKKFGILSGEKTVDSVYPRKQALVCRHGPVDVLVL